MEIISVTDVSSAIKELLTGNQSVTDSTRQDAQKQVRAICKDRIFKGRIPQSVEGACIVLQVVSTEREYFLDGEDDCVFSGVELRMFCDSDREKVVLADACRQLLTAFSGSVKTADDTTFQIGVCILGDDGDVDPEDPDDGSIAWRFLHSQVWEVLHEQVSLSGLK